MTYDDDNRLATFKAGNVSHDLDGNMTYGPGTNNTFGSYSYDARNRLLSAGGLNYGYDPAGNRVSVTNGASVSRFTINPNAALSQVLMRVKGGATNYYVYGLGLLYEADDSGNSKTYHYDYRGSTVALTDGSGVVTDRIEYSAYGMTAYRSGTTDTPFLLNGRYGVQTDSNGLLYMRARFYNPYIYRFLNPDPAGFSGGLNFYAYADGNPVSYLDPFGLGAVTEGGFGAGLNYWVGGPARAGAGWAYDLVYDPAATVTGLASETAGTVLDMIGDAFLGNPNLGQSLRGFATDEYNSRSPAARAGWYDPNNPATQAATISTVFINPEAVAAKTTTSLARSPWPGNSGFIEGTVERQFLMPGQVIDRYGFGGGRFVSPAGTSVEARALRPGTENLPFNSYQVVKPIEVNAGGVQPWFGQPGLGTQYELPVSVNVLLNRGIIKPVP